MDLELEILKEHSRRQAVRIAGWIGDDDARFAALMKLFLSGEQRVVQRSSWIVSVCGEHHPALITPWLAKIIARAGEVGVHNAVKRNSVRVLQFVDIPRRMQGKAANLCFDFLQDHTIPISVKAFSMTVLVNIAMNEPDLKHEIKLVIEQMLPYGSAGIRSRGGKALKQLSK